VKLSLLSLAVGDNFDRLSADMRHFVPGSPNIAAGKRGGIDAHVNV